MERTAHPLNAPGPFFVIHGQCLMCTAPENEAPDLMGHEEIDYHCYFRRQPSTPEELDRAIRAVQVSCCGAVRYAGKDPETMKRILAWNPDGCDCEPT